MRAAAWPSIKLQYSLMRNGEVLASGEETVSDMDYLRRINTYPASDPLRYDKWMLDDWFAHRIVERRPPQQ